MFRSLRKSLVLFAVVLGAILGSYGIASAASGSSQSSTAAATAAAPAQPAQGSPWGGQRSDETPLTGDALAKVKAAALDRVGSDATIVRVETDADGHAKYEAHIQQADGTPATVYVDATYNVVGVETR